MRTEFMGFRLEADLRAAIETTARDSGRKMSAVIRDILSEWVKKRTGEAADDAKRDD